MHRHSALETLYKVGKYSTNEKQSLTFKELKSLEILQIACWPDKIDEMNNLLSKELGHNFFDIDQIIEKNYKTTISNFFEIYGEKKFRDTESSMLKKLNGGIISCGGGIILNNDNISFMKDNGICILLKASTNTLKSRISGNNSRPLLKQDEDKTRIDTIWKERREKYLYAADYEFNTDQKTPVQITSKIIETIFL